MHCPASRLWIPFLTLAAIALPAREASEAGDISAKLYGHLQQVLAATKADDFMRVSVVLAEQADRARVERASAIADKRTRRRVVVGLLRDTAQATQGSLLAFLEQSRTRGSVRGEVKSLWIHNVVSVEAQPAMIHAIAARPEVAWVHHDPPRGLEVLAPIDDKAPTLAPTSGGTPTCGLDRIGAPEVWAQHGITGAGVVVGVIDTGLCLTHPDIAGQVWVNPCEIPDNDIDDDGNGYVDDVHGWNFQDDSKDIDDLLNHGSHVSGTIAGDGSSGTQCGVAPDARIMVLKFANHVGGEQSVWESMQYGVDNGAHVLSGSLGWPHHSGPARTVWRFVCENSIAAGTVVVFEAGSSGCNNPPDDVLTPGDVPDVMTVGTVACDDVITSFSSCGPVTWQGVMPWDDWPYPPGLVKPDVVGPGVNTISHSLCDGYTAFSGSAMSTAHASGLVALVLEADPMLDHFGVKALLESTAVDLGAAGKDNSYGAGRIDALASVEAALGNGNHCEAKLASCGSLPDIHSAGMPSATATSGFTVTGTGLRGRQNGMLIYSDQGPNNVPFQGGSLCLRGPRRSVLRQADGSAGQCDGSISLDMNTYGRGLLGGPPPAFAVRAGYDRSLPVLAARSGQQLQRTLDCRIELRGLSIASRHSVRASG